VITPRRKRLAVRLAEIERRTGVPHESVLRDHALSYMLAGISAIPELAEQIVFKGGTALRKCYFAGYRYSEDLDFSSRDLRVWTAAEMTALLEAACGAARALAETIEAPYAFSPRLERHRIDRTNVQHNFRITVEYPTGATLPIKFELTQVEPVLCPIEVRSVVHEFVGEPLDVTMSVYALNEVVLEKLRAFLQTSISLERRDWTNRARDLYDLWWLMEKDAPVGWQGLRALLATKAAARGIAFSGPEDFLDPRVLRSYRGSWTARLANVVPYLPAFDDALIALRTVIGLVFDTEAPNISID
jgi:predicted nucleotidyltransferase component of viral defense system